MIAPRDDTEAPDLSVSVDDFFSPGGVMEKACAHDAFPYEFRPQQRDMARAVARTLSAPGHLMVEAGTGVGKSFAYLVPFIQLARETGEKTVVATYTISLQEQLTSKDVPFLKSHWRDDFTAVLVKGQSNYLCRRRLARAERYKGDLFTRWEESDLKRIKEWASITADGSLQDLPPQVSRGLWTSVCVEEGNCRGQKCPEFNTCFFMKARRRMHSADLLIANHHLLFSDLSLRQRGAALLPSYRALLMDEAHMMEAAAGEHFGIRLSQYAVEHCLRRLYVPEKNKGLLALLKKGDLAHEVTRLWDDADRLFADLEKWCRFRDDESCRPVEEPLDVNQRAVDGFVRISRALKELAAEVKDEELGSELAAVRKRTGELAAELAAFLEHKLEDQVYWMEKEGKRRRLVLHSAPIEVAPILKSAMFEAVRNCIMTSATLAVNDRFDYFTSRIGAEDAESLAVGSPFDYARQMRLVMPARMPDPKQSGHYIKALIHTVEHYIRETDGGAFVLFTSFSLLKQVVEKVRDDLERDGFTILAQGTGHSRHMLLEQFKTAPKAALFGVDSFWMGVDVRGDALKNVIITRLPFSVPDRPLIKARMRRIQDRGGDPFKELSLPEAILKFRQGVGRLIRTATDEGIVVILDSRVRERWYGKLFIKALPECEQVVDEPFGE